MLSGIQDERKTPGTAVAGTELFRRYHLARYQSPEMAKQTIPGLYFVGSVTVFLCALALYKVLSDWPLRLVGGSPEILYPAFIVAFQAMVGGLWTGMECVALTSPDRLLVLFMGIMVFVLVLVGLAVLSIMMMIDKMNGIRICLLGYFVANLVCLVFWPLLRRFTGAYEIDYLLEYIFPMLYDVILIYYLTHPHVKAQFQRKT